MKICIDPGHGPKGNPYPQRPGYYEGAQMFKLAQYQKAALEQYEDVTVILTRESVEENPPLNDRGAMAEGCDLFYSDHSNAYGDPSKYSSPRGVTVIDSHKKPNKALADNMGRTVAAAMGNNFRGTTYREIQEGKSFTTPQPSMIDYYGVIRAAVATTCKAALIVEHGFHSNEEDSAFLIDDENLQRMAEAEAVAIAAHYGLKRRAEPEKPETYTVRGDTLFSIGETLGIPWQDIAAENRLTPPYELTVGQVLTLPRKVKQYTVMKGDTTWSIAKKLYGKPQRYVEIEQLNGLAGEYVLTVGQVLTVPAK